MITANRAVDVPYIVEAKFWIDRREAETASLFATMGVQHLIRGGTALRRNPAGPSRPDRDSTGRLIHATAKGRAAFWRWFGGSVLRDGQGRPLVLFHGTDKAFKAFKASEDGHYGAGVYLTAVPGRASHYAGDDAGRVLPVFARLERPLVVEMTARGSGYKTWTSMLLDPKRKGAKVRIAAWLQQHGYDGVVLVDDREPGAPVFDAVVYDPKAIKSARGNRGTFSRRSGTLTNPAGIPSGFPHVRSAAAEAAWLRRWCDLAVWRRNEEGKITHAEAHSLIQHIKALEYLPEVQQFARRLARRGWRPDPNDIQPLGRRPATAPGGLVRHRRARKLA
jgi:hypothetical protein